MPDESQVQSASDLCSKCGAAIDTKGYPLWCQACRNKYQREYQQTVKKMGNGKGFAAGVAATKECLAEEFDRLGSGMFSGYEVGYLIRQAPGPAMPAD